MPHFPVSNSNLSAVHLGIFLQNQYLIPGNIHCRIIKAGINDTYMVDNGDDRYVFRVYSLHWRTRNEIEEELRLLNTLKAQEISISYPISRQGPPFYSNPQRTGRRTVWGPFFICQR